MFNAKNVNIHSFQLNKLKKNNIRKLIWTHFAPVLCREMRKLCTHIINELLLFKIIFLSQKLKLLLFGFIQLYYLIDTNILN